MKPHEYLEDVLRRYPDIAEIREDLFSAFEALKKSYEAGGKLLVAGNGGSAADADHICGELLKGFLKKRPYKEEKNLSQDFADAPEDFFEHLQKGLPAISLMNNPALVSAFANDIDAAYSYAQQVGVYGQKKDVFLGISTSGNSRNVWLAMLMAKHKGLTTVALTGKTGGKLVALADVTIRVPETETFLIQERHLPIYHGLCAALEEHFFSEE